LRLASAAEERRRRAAQEEQARRLALQRAREEAERRAAQAAAEAQEEEEEQQASSQPSAAEMFNVFATTLNRELQAENARRQQQQQFLDNLQAQARAQQQARRAQQEREARAADQARLAAMERDLRASARAREEAEERARAAERERQAALAADQARRRAQVVAAASVPAPTPAPVQRQAPSQPTMQVAGRDQDKPRESTAPPARKRIAYPEAIVVCTIPNEKSQFVCKSPVNSISGHKDIHPSQWRTPASMVADMTGACRDARQLRSTTHLVWGCGFAATNTMVGYYDRGGPGVDVDGRKTFYCYEGESGCRRTEP
jgi:hypothetical protein